MTRSRSKLDKCRLRLPCTAILLLTTVSEGCHPEGRPGLAAADGEDYLPSPVRVLSRSYPEPESFVDALTTEEHRTIRSEVQDTGFSQSVLIGAKSCESCHRDIALQWSESAHRFSSFNNPFYAAAINELRGRPDGVKKSRWCAGCHDPALLLPGDFDQVFEPNGTQAQAGLTCLVCHSIVDVPSTVGNGSYVIAPRARSATDATRSGKATAHRQGVITARHRTSEFCSACHKVSLDSPINDYRWLRGQNEYDSWHDSGVSGNAARSFGLRDQTSAQKCQDCHMPLEKVVYGDRAASNGLIRSHRFLGANTALPALRNDMAALELQKRHLQTAGISVDIFALRRGNGLSQIAPIPDITQPVLLPGEEVQADVVIKNDGVGHSFPGGTLDSNECWVEFVVTDDRGNKVASNGLVKDDGSLDGGSHVLGALFLDEENRPVTKRNVQDIRTLAWNKSIPSGGADVVRYRFRVPENLNQLTISVRLRYRKFNEPFRKFACATHPGGFPRGCPELPITDIDTASLILRVSADRTVEVESKFEADPEILNRFSNFGIGSLLQLDTASAEYAFGVVGQRAQDRASTINLARSALLAGDADRALGLLSESRSTQGMTDPRIAWLTGMAHSMRREYNSAAEWFRRAVELRPSDRESLRMWGQSLMQTGEYELALSAFTRILMLDVEDAWAHQQAGEALARLGRNREARTHQQLFERYREDPAVYNRRDLYCESNEDAFRESMLYHSHSAQ